MGLVFKFRQWLSEHLRVDYDSIAADVRGLAEHTEAEISAIQSDIEAELQKLMARIEKLEHPLISITTENPTVGLAVQTPSPVPATQSDGFDVQSGA